MANALIGYTGYVGSTLLKQTQFDALYRSTNIEQISGQTFDFVVCAGAPAQKWIANREPEADRQKIDCLIDHLKAVNCKRFILISTVDVFKNPNGVDESSAIDENGLHPYGLNRRKLETFVGSHFSNHLIVRLPGLVGPGLRKNVIYDCLNNNNIQEIESRSVFQFYPMVNLWSDLSTAMHAGIRTLHLTAEPVSVREIAKQGFGLEFNLEKSATPAHYDMRTLHAEIFGARGSYQYSARETLLAVRAYAQSEKKS